MTSPASYNRGAVVKHCNLKNIPVEWQGYAILLRSDPDHDMVIDEDELDLIDWISFSEVVEDFQLQAGVEPQDAKLGPNTLRRLRKAFAVQAPDVLKQIGEDVVFPPSETPVSEPSAKRKTSRKMVDMICIN